MYRFLLLLIAGLAIGCGSAPEPSAEVEKDRLESAQKLRSAFDSVGGDYQKLAPGDREELIKMFDNNEQNLQRTWNFMLEKGRTQTGTGTAGMPGAR